MGVNEADRLEKNPDVKVVESDEQGLYYILGATLTTKQKNIGICGQRVEGMPDEAVFFTKKQLIALAAELPELIKLYC